MISFFDNILFFCLLVGGVGLFIRNMKRIYQNILRGQRIPEISDKKERWLLVLKVAFGQGRVSQKPFVGVLHFVVYFGFFIINLEFLEILIDGLFGTYRVFALFLGNEFYSKFTFVLEIIAVLTAIAVIVFFLRRNLIKIPRLNHSDIKGWAKYDANFILVFEFLLMWAFLQMNAADSLLQSRNLYIENGFFPVSEFIFGRILQNFNNDTLVFIERASWWFHFVGILFFLNYLCFSKHLHIFLAFPNIWYSYKKEKGKIGHLESITQEIRQMFNPQIQENLTEMPPKLGVEDVFDLSRIQLLNAYSCVECGRCTEVCPANLTGKKLSPRKVMMSVRKRSEELRKKLEKNPDFKDGKTLYDDISEEEIWACTTCFACAEACPLYIDPSSVIVDLRRFLVMEKSSAPQELHRMMNNVENYSAPWQYPSEDRGKWAREMDF